MVSRLSSKWGTIREHTSGNTAAEGILSCCILRCLVEAHTGSETCNATWDDPLLHCALLSFVCSVMRQGEKAAVIETSWEYLSPLCSDESLFVSQLSKLIFYTFCGITHGKSFTVTQDRTGILSFSSQVKWSIGMVPILGSVYKTIEDSTVVFPSLPRSNVL